jgi:hypothetical protein
MVGQDASSRGMQQKINETHTAILGGFELAKQSQEIVNKEMAQLKEITSEIQGLIRNIEKSDTSERVLTHKLYNFLFKSKTISLDVQHSAC